MQMSWDEISITTEGIAKLLKAMYGENENV